MARRGADRCPRTRHMKISYNHGHQDLGTPAQTGLAFGRLQKLRG